MTTPDTIKALQSMLLSPDRSIQAVAATIATPEQFEQALLGLGINEYHFDSILKRGELSMDDVWAVKWFHWLGGDYNFWIILNKENHTEYSIRLNMSRFITPVVKLHKPLTFMDIKADIRTISDALTEFCAAVQKYFRS